MTVGVLGSGFGLYGYLPALIAAGETVAMPSRYREKLASRDDVARFAADIEWAGDDTDLMLRSQALVLARRPADNLDFVRRALEMRQIDRFILEKPLSPDPDTAGRLLDMLEAAGKCVRIGFTFRYTGWVPTLRDWLGRNGEGARIAFRWRFRAHHFANGLDNWKRRPSQGGGALRFYGIHLLALLSELGYSRVDQSSIRAEQDDDARSWNATLSGNGLPSCDVSVDSDSERPEFAIHGTGGDAPISMSLSDPFESPVTDGSIDRRVPLLLRVCTSHIGDSRRVLPWYRGSTELWKAAELRHG